MSVSMFDDIEATARLIMRQKNHRVLAAEHALLSVLTSEYGRKTLAGVGADVSRIESVIHAGSAAAQSVYASRPDEFVRGVTREYARCISAPSRWCAAGMFARVGVRHLLVALADPGMSSSLAVKAFEAGGVSIRLLCDALDMPDLASASGEDHLDHLGGPDHDESGDMIDQIYGLSGDADSESGEGHEDDEHDLNKDKTVKSAPATPHDYVLSILRDLRKDARLGKINPVIGRSSEMASLLHVLMRHRKPNALLVGHTGVGKTAVVEGLVLHLEKSGSSDLSENPFYCVSVTDLVRGTRFRGDLEDRVAALISVCEERAAVLVIDEAHMLAGGNSEGGQSTILDAFKPSMARGGFRMILATTPHELRRISKDKAFMRRLQRIDIMEPDVKMTKDIVLMSSDRYASHHAVAVSPSVVDSVIAAAQRHLPGRYFPDKAFDILDASLVSARSDGHPFVRESDIAVAVEAVTGRKIDACADVALSRLDGIEERLKARVFGHDGVIDSIVRSLRMQALGLLPDGAPLSAIMVGPTGVGKTELAKALAAELDMGFRRYDMSEYMESHSVSRLIGAPPGYVGHNAPGFMIDAADSSRPTIHLLDEIEKAHPDIFDLLLQVLDYGSLTGGDGVVVSFSGHILLMTSNTGAQKKTSSIGFGRSDNMDSDVREALKSVFRPEFLGRIRDILVFSGMDEAMAMSIARSAANRSMEDLSKRGIVVSPDFSEIASLARRSVDSGGGGRAVIKSVQDYLFDLAVRKHAENIKPEKSRALQGVGV